MEMRLRHVMEYDSSKTVNKLSIGSGEAFRFHEFHCATVSVFHRPSQKLQGSMNVNQSRLSNLQKGRFPDCKNMEHSYHPSCLT